MSRLTIQSEIDHGTPHSRDEDLEIEGASAARPHRIETGPRQMQHHDDER